MMFSYFKFIVANVFMINMQFSKINCSINAVVALLKITYDDEYIRFVTESVDAYLTRNTKKIDERTGLPCLFNIVYQRDKIADDPMNDNICYVNQDDLLIMSAYQATLSFNINRKYITTMNIMKQKEANLVNPEAPIFHHEKLYDKDRQEQFYRYLLYPYEKENIYNYWNRVETKLKSCLQNNNEFDFIDTKVEHIDNIGNQKIFVQQNDGETDDEFADRLLKQHIWFYIMVATRPLYGESIENYHLRNVRLGFSGLPLNNLKLFYSDYTIKINSYEWDSIKISEIKQNFSVTEFFILHIIYHCKLPPSELIQNEFTENEAPKKNKRERGESSSSKRIQGINP